MCTLSWMCDPADLGLVEFHHAGCSVVKFFL